MIKFLPVDWFWSLLESTKLTLNFASISYPFLTVSAKPSLKSQRRGRFDFHWNKTHEWENVMAWTNQVGSELVFTMCGNPSNYFGFWKEGRVILKKGGFKPALANHTKENFGLSRAFLSQIQRLVRRLVNQISSYTMRTHQSFLIYEQVTFMLYYRIHERQISKASKLLGFWGQMENYCCHYQQQWQNFFAR